MATLYLMVGIPGAGKTTYAKRRLSKAIRIGSDDIRKELFGKELTLKGYRNVHRILQRKTARYLANEQDVVVDCMNASVRARKVYFQLLPSNSSIVAIYLDTPFRIALQNNRRRKRQVPPAGILWNWLRIRKPKEKEGFDQVIVEHYKPHNRRKGLDRKRVENVWKGTWINKHSAYDHRIFICSRCRKQISIQGEMLQFCPACGAANTDRAIDIVVRRLTNVYRDSLRCKKLEQIKKEDDKSDKGTMYDFIGSGDRPCNSGTEHQRRDP